MQYMSTERSLRSASVAVGIREGIELDSEQPLVAAPSAPEAALPPNWSEHLDDEGYPYYYNCVTDESTWVRPEPERVSYTSVDVPYSHDIVYLGAEHDVTEFLPLERNKIAYLQVM